MSHSQGTICANFGYSRGPWKPCLWAYHGHCYTIGLEQDPFPKGLQPKDTEEDESRVGRTEVFGWEITKREKEDLDRLYTCARRGDHLMTSFQCELCHFHNIFARDPDEKSVSDHWILVCCVRVNLDAFRARRPSTVQNNFQEISRMAAQMGLDYPIRGHPRGPYPLRDDMGMVAAITSLQRSMDLARNSHTIQ
ncbi:hypothetical protein ACA910_021360 [Epithemia clementina (nom. ined.)]